MTVSEIQTKITRIQVSDAPTEVKEAAIRKLENNLKSTIDIAKQQYLDAAPDINDIGD